MMATSALVYVRTWDSDGIAAKFRYWLRRDGDRWRLFDLEDLAGGARFSAGAAAVGTQLTSGDQARFMAAVQQIPEVTRALIAVDLDKAEQLLNGIDTSVLPSSFQAWVQVQHAVVHIGRNKYQQAIDTCNQAEQLNSNLPILLLLRAQAHNGLGQYEQGRADAQKYLDTLGEDADGYLHLGQALAGLRKQDEAIAAFSRGLKDEPNSTELLYQLAVHLPEDKLDVLKQHFGKVGKPNEQFSATGTAAGECLCVYGPRSAGECLCGNRAG